MSPAFQIEAASSPGHFKPLISGNRVVWWDAVANAFLMVRLGESLEPETIVSGITTPNDLDIDLAGEILTWTSEK